MGDRQALPILFGQDGTLEVCRGCNFTDQFLKVVQRNAEELLAQVDLVHSLVIQDVVQLRTVRDIAEYLENAE